MKPHLFIGLVLAAGIVFYSTSCSAPPANDTPEETTASSTEDIVERGEYLVHIMGCNDCHSPKKIGPNGPEIIPELLLAGYPKDRPILKLQDTLTQQGFARFYPDLTAAAGPWGISFAANLTPHETGIGSWTEEQFKKALTQGIYKGIDGGRMMLPPMPWFNYSGMNDDDINAIFTYLKSIPAVDNMVPAPIGPETM